MSMKLEHSSSWERHSIVIENSSNEEQLKRLIPWQTLGEMWLDPLPYQVDQVDSCSQEQSRLSNLNSLVHQLDISTRKLVGEMCKDYATKHDKTQLQNFSSTLTKLRNEFMSELRNGRLVPESTELASSTNFFSKLFILKCQQHSKN